MWCVDCLVDEMVKVVGGCDGVVEIEGGDDVVGYGELVGKWWDVWEDSRFVVVCVKLLCLICGCVCCSVCGCIVCLVWWLCG